jgi:transketolase
LRFVNVPLDLPYSMPADYALKIGRGVTLRPGKDVALIGYGTILLTNAWRAAEELASQGISAAVIDLPWLNRIDDRWVADALSSFKHVVTLDNHYLEFGQGVMVAAALARTGVRAEMTQLGLKEIPACGSNADVLAYHGLDAASIARTVAAKNVAAGRS